MGVVLSAAFCGVRFSAIHLPEIYQTGPPARLRAGEIDATPENVEAMIKKYC